jgi:hypothetical protein
MPHETTSLAEFQTAFAARIRHPGLVKRPAGVNARRMRVYEKLLFNNVEGFLLACYPVSRAVLRQRRWGTLVRGFFHEYRSHSPLFRDIPKAFLDWMNSSAQSLEDDFPFLLELMHYEWLELAVSIDPATLDMSTVEPHGDLWQGEPVLNPTARLGCYRYPLHRISPQFRPKPSDAGLFCYLLYRDEGHVVRFVQMTPFTAALIESLQDARVTGHELVQGLLNQLPDANARRESLLLAGQAALDDLRNKGVLLGIWRKK